MFERPNALLQIARDDDGAYWLGSQRGLWRVQPGQIPVPVPLGGQGIVKPMTALLRTDDGALWVPVAGADLGYLRSDWRDVAQISRSGVVLDRQSVVEGQNVALHVDIGGRAFITKRKKKNISIDRHKSTRNTGKT